MTQLGNNPPGHPAVPETVLTSVQTAVGGLSQAQLLYIEGFIAGLRLGGGASAAPVTTATAAAPASLTILYGSESGNSEGLADATAKAAKAKGFQTTVVNMADTTPKKIAAAENLLLLISTWGEGDPPETAIGFFEALMANNAPRFEKTRFSVLALGDTSYEHFCKTGKDIDTRLETLGARRILARVDCDVDFDIPYQKWCTDVLEALGVAVAPAAVVATSTVAAVAPSVEYGRKNPFPSTLKEKILLNGRGSAKETIHFELSLEGSGLEYKPGDSLAVVPHNCAEVVESVLKAARLDGSQPVTVKEFQGDLRTALTSQLDITTLTLPVIKRYAEIAKTAQLDDLLKPEAKGQLAEYLAGRDLADLLGDFPSEITADALAAICRRLPPRLYSIASSPKAHPGEVHLTVAVVRYDAHGRKRKGVCSTYLADRLEIDEKAEVYITANKHFKLPNNPETPIIMVGPGTGIAPFRAFIEERAAIGAKGENWLIFGDQHYLTDFLYQTEWQSYLADGVLHRLDVAFSRDQPQKVYVQDRIREKAKDLFAWLERGAYFYVCGDASRMAVDVDKALHDVITQAGGKSDEEATEYVKQLKAEKRYLRDVY